jgi:glycosyltransferase involved in cell wall biosynthesis
MCSDISCVVPTWNSALFLHETFDSLLFQKGCQVRIVVVDSGSEDATLSMCSDFGVEVIYEPPGNMYRAINVGLQRCDTEWLAYTNSDDLWYFDALARMIRTGAATDADLVYGTCDYVDSYGRFLHSYMPPSASHLISWYRCSVMPFAQQTVIFRRKLFQQLDGFDTSYRLAGDFDFYLRACLAQARFVCMRGIPVAKFRLHDNQLSLKQRQQILQETARSSLENGLTPRLIDRTRVLAWRLSNAPNYLGRILRRRQLTGRLSLPDTMIPLSSSR